MSHSSRFIIKGGGLVIVLLVRLRLRLGLSKKDEEINHGESVILK
jgi:hypothetical protein